MYFRRDICGLPRQMAACPNPLVTPPRDARSVVRQVIRFVAFRICVLRKADRECYRSEVKPGIIAKRKIVYQRIKSRVAAIDETDEARMCRAFVICERLGMQRGRPQVKS